MSGFRGRLLATVVGLVALTSLVLGLAAYGYLAISLRDQQLREATAQTNFNVAVLADERLPPDATRDDLAASDLLEAFQLRGGVGTVVDFGDGDPFVSGFEPAAAFAALSPGLRRIVDGGQIGYERLTVGGRPYLVTGARRPPGGPDFYFFFDAGGVEEAIRQAGQGLLLGSLSLIAVAVVAGGAVTRRVLRPVRAASAAAHRIATGDLSARLEVGAGDDRDEFARWARSFNSMAASLAATISELETAQSRQRAFVADVSHELRTPLTALVQEAALLSDHLATMPRAARRVSELLVHDVARLRGLVDELLEISAFDAAAEVVLPSEVDLASTVRAMVADRVPGAALQLPDEPLRVVTDRRRIERILANLLDNALEHGEARDVSVSLARGAGSIRLTVADRGPGVPATELPHLFERFHKADPSRHRGGSGLGLAIAREHATLLGATLRAHLRAGGGIAFVLELPVTELLPGGDVSVIPARDADAPMEPVPEPTP